MKILIIGGTRNMGHILATELFNAGHELTIFNRGITQDDLPAPIKRLRGDRTVKEQVKAALGGLEFDVVVDMVLYTGEEAENIIDILAGRVGHYIFVSTGQVYLVREGLERPFSEGTYEGRLMPPPKPNTYGYEEWNYGFQKRRAEDALTEAWSTNGFPYTSLRMPMVNGEREPFNRLYGYMLRIKDGGPILVPETPQHPLRHVYADDVVQAIISLINTGAGKGRAYNISQDETVPLPEFVAMVGEFMGYGRPHMIEVKRSLLVANGFLPDCSPFSDRWMSELANERSKDELGMVYTPLRTYLERIVRHYQDNPPQRPASYRRRNAERNLVLQT
jgi:nucleoside-diphosphate-sugar epimerase